MTKTAIVRAKVVCQYAGHYSEPVVLQDGLPDYEEWRLSTDLPAGEIGVLARKTIERAWRAGYDPVKDKLAVILTFS